MHITSVSHPFHIHIPSISIHITSISRTYHIQITSISHPYNFISMSHSCHIHNTSMSHSYHIHLILSDQIWSDLIWSHLLSSPLLSSPLLSSHLFWSEAKLRRVEPICFDLIKVLLSWDELRQVEMRWNWLILADAKWAELRWTDPYRLAEIRWYEMK